MAYPQRTLEKHRTHLVPRRYRFCNIPYIFFVTTPTFPVGHLHVYYADERLEKKK